MFLAKLRLAGSHPRLKSRASLEAEQPGSRQQVIVLSPEDRLASVAWNIDSAMFPSGCTGFSRRSSAGQSP